MKTAVSIPDDLYEEAERTAARLGFNRSQLYATALEAFLADQDDDPVTAKLDELAAEFDTSPDSGLDSVGRGLIDAGTWEW